MKSHIGTMGRLAFATLGVTGALALASPARAVESHASVEQSHTIGYVLSERFWGLYLNAHHEECPDGLNDGPREQFKILYPDNGKKQNLLDTALAREAEIWFPTRDPDPPSLPFHEASGKIAIGLNLDGKIGPNDFTSPDGEKGIDNQFYRAIGCIADYRGPDGAMRRAENTNMQDHQFDRTVIELTNVDNLQNDDDVTVTTYRTLNRLIHDASGSWFVPGGTQTIDMRWGKEFIFKLHGKIKNGVLTTDPQDIVLPGNAVFQDTTVFLMRGAVIRLKLTPEGAQGLIAGYNDIETYYRHLVEGRSTHHLSYGQQAAASLYKALWRLADGYPDPATGMNTAISSAMQVRFIQAFINHPDSLPDGRTVADQVRHERGVSQ